MEELFSSLQTQLGSTLPLVLGAFVVLLAGWIAALLVRAVLRKALTLLHVNRGIQSATGATLDIETWIVVGAFYLVLFFTLMAFFNVLRLEMVSGSLQALLDQVMGFAPKAVAGGVLLLIAWGLATVARAASTKALEATRLDEKLAVQAGMPPFSKTLGSVAFWLTLLLMLPAVLGALGLEGLLAPVQGMVETGLGVLPRALGALAIGLVGWFLARILREVVTNLLGASPLDAWGDRAGIKGGLKISRMAGYVVYLFVFVPALIAALETLQIEAVSKPAIGLLDTMMGAIPGIFAAGLILGVSFFIGRLAAQVIAGVLSGLGFNHIPAVLGVEVDSESGRTPSSFVGNIVLFYIMLFATAEAATQLGFEQVAGVVGTVIGFGGQVLLGVTIIGVGIWLARLAGEGLAKTAASPLTVSILRFAILGIVFAMGLRAMGLADDIVNLAFSFTLGSVAVAVALSFGLGGREAAGRLTNRWVETYVGGKQPKGS